MTIALHPAVKKGLSSSNLSPLHLTVMEWRRPTVNGQEDLAMSNQQLGPLEVCCDAPPYPVVQACSQIGFDSPEDCRWCRMSHREGASAALRHIAKFAPWNMFMSTQQSPSLCSCGERLPQLACFVFTLDTGREIAYYLGQCGRCHAVYWEDA
jgi:hypothetical protein